MLRVCLFLEVDGGAGWGLEGEGGATILIGDGEVALVDDIHADENVIVFDGEAIDFEIVDYLSVGEGYGYLVQVTFTFAYSSGFDLSEGLEVEGFGNVWGYDSAFGSCVPSGFFGCEFEGWEFSFFEVRENAGEGCYLSCQGVVLFGVWLSHLLRVTVGTASISSVSSPILWIVR